MYIINIRSAHEMRFHYQILPTKHVEKFIYTKYSTYGRDLTHGITTNQLHRVTNNLAYVSFTCSPPE
jgi:hypothetical protein